MFGMFRLKVGKWRRAARRRDERTVRGPEWLEPRQMLAVNLSSGGTIEPLDFTVSGGGLPSGLTPNAVRQAYGVDQLALPNGGAADGSGQTIAIVSAYGNSNIAGDLQTFNQTFGLPQAKLQQVDASQATPQTASSAGSSAASTSASAAWSLETALDLEWAHAIAPAASLLLVNAANDSLGSLLGAVDYARQQSGVAAVSMSWGTNEFPGETSYDNLFTTPSGHAPVAFVAASGDYNASAVWPAASPNVLSVGGTSLELSQGNYAGETAWSGSGHGASVYETEPAYQSAVQSTGSRATPDVAYNADPQAGYAVYSSTPYNGQTGWFQVGGTSAGAPQWSALIALADQARAANGSGPVTNVPAAMYTLPSTAFHPLAAGGSSTAGSSSAGFDPVTGLGSPVASTLVSDLVTATGNTPTTAGTSTTHTGTSPGTGATGHATPLELEEAALVAFLAASPQGQPVQPVGAAGMAVPIVASAAVPPAIANPTIGPTAGFSSLVDLNLTSPRASQAEGQDDEAVSEPLPPGTSEPVGRTGSVGRTGVVALVRGAGGAMDFGGVVGGASREALCDACFSDASWSAVPELTELPLFGLGEASESLPSPVFLMAALLTSFEGYRRLRKQTLAATT